MTDVMVRVQREDLGTDVRFLGFIITPLIGIRLGGGGRLLVPLLIFGTGRVSVFESSRDICGSRGRYLIGRVGVRRESEIVEGGGV